MYYSVISERLRSEGLKAVDETALSYRDNQTEYNMMCLNDKNKG